MKKIWAVLVTLLIAVMITGCSGKDAKDEGSKDSGATKGTSTEADGKTTFGLEPFEKRQTVSVGFFSGSPHSIPFYIAEQEGFLDELNIDIEYQSFINGPAMMEANNSWDIADTGAPGVLVGQIGYDVKMIGVADYEGNLGLFVRKDSPLANSTVDSNGVKGSADEWKGTKWLYPVGTNLHMTLAAATNNVGISLEDIETVNMDVTSAFTAFKGGEGDGMAVWNAIAFNAEDEGFVRIGDASTLGVVSTCGLVATQDALDNKRELIEKVWQVYYLTWQWANESDENMQKAIDYFVESCEIEGVISDRSIAERAMALYMGPAPDKAVALFTDKEADRLGKYTSRELLAAENDLLETLDFFIEQGKYTEDDRNKLLDNNMVDPSIAEASAEVFKSLGIIK